MFKLIKYQKSDLLILKMNKSKNSKYNSISSDKKYILINCYKNGKTIKESAGISGININTAKSILTQCSKNDGVFVQKKRGGKRRTKITENILKKIEQAVEENPCVTLKTIRLKIQQKKRMLS